jgi:dihydroorotate dehydrogenase electron transfer subunit
MAELIKKPEEIAENHFLLNIKIDSNTTVPGQFVNVRAAEGFEPMLRRPFSIFDSEGDTISIVVRVIGRGTSLISEMNPGPINITGPSGSGFTMEEGKEILVAGGGVGNAPLYYLMKELKKRGNRITYIYCAGCSDFIFAADMYRDLADEFIVATDDGSAGVKGFGTDVMAHVISGEQFSRIYTCGPDPMMGKIVKLAHKNVPVEVSVENYFGCGVGLCVGCTVDTVDGYKRACVEGPVMDGRKILWDNMPD